ncbi:MAG: c-type cytochrome [Parvibaculales bacterium]
MDGFELNKIAGAVLAALLVFIGIQNLGDVLFHVEPANEQAYVVEGVEVAGGAGAQAIAEEEPDIRVLLASANIDKGMKVAKKCVSCHAFEKGGAHKIGPALYGVVNREIAVDNGYAYSGVLAGLGGVWDYEALNGFLENPKKYAAGTKMAFAGLRKSSDRANIIAYLRDNADTPAPLTE